MRTPAENYFGPEGFTELVEALTKFGQEKLGCTAISPPWLSVYVDGCEQRYHTDSWHGPWAFVLSLTGKNGVYSAFVALYCIPRGAPVIDPTEFWERTYLRLPVWHRRQARFARRRLW